jgi:hypothetical protein
MRNIFDQYTQPENRLTHSIAAALHHDKSLLKSFLAVFGPAKPPAATSLTVIEQGLPGTPEVSEDEAEARGLPDALIYNNEGWALAIESKVNSALTKNQLQRHQRTVERCGFTSVRGLAITLREPGFILEGWRTVTWKDIYSWANGHRSQSQWAGFLVEYFNVAEARMANSEYLKEGTITEFSGISFNPYTYLEGKRVLRLLTQKLRDNTAFVKKMRLDPATGRSSITEQGRLWDFVSFIAPAGKDLEFQKYPHCTVGIGPNDAEAFITIPNGMSPTLRKRLHGSSFDEFAQRLRQASDALAAALPGLKAWRPMARVQQRRYASQRSVPMRDGMIEFDLRTITGDASPHFGPPIHKQQQWARGAYELLVNKRSNIQFQIGAQFDYPALDELAHRDSHRHFAAAFAAVLPFVAPVID